MKLLKKIKNILEIDSFVSKKKEEEEQRNQRGIALIAAGAFFVMSLLNIKQGSMMMLATTSISAILFAVGALISKYKNSGTFLRAVYYSIFIVLFTSYTVMGGNNGFAALWLIIATHAVMIAIDFKAGFLIGLYYFIMLLLVFIGPLSSILQYEYDETFMLRFPFLFAANFAFATFIAIRIRTYQYELLLKQQELEYFNTTDLSTGLMNRNRFIQDERVFQAENLKNLFAVFIDVNGLHEINNCYGHSAGDAMLCMVSNSCKKHFEAHDIYRMGGDEFLILCKNTIEEEVYSAVQNLCNDVSVAGYSISFGIDKQETDFNLEELVKSADSKMIECKKNHYQISSSRTDWSKK